MSRYLVRRLIQAIPLILGISVISFLAMKLMPGGPLAGYLMNPKITPADIARIERLWGLDQPLVMQYWKWFTSMLRGDWGWSYRTGLPVLEMFMQRLPNTVVLMGFSYLLSVLVAVPIGIYSAIKKYSVLDYTFTLFAFIGVAIPSFWFGIMLQLIFSVNLGWLPSAGMMNVGAPFSLMDRILHLIMPVLVLGMVSMAGWSRYMRSSMVETIKQDYIRTARSKGLSEKIVIFKHALRNAMIPLVTMMGLALPAIFGGAVITEQIFAWPGMGHLFVTSISSRDYPILMASLMLTAVTVVIGNLLADLFYGFLDPRIRYE